MFYSAVVKLKADRKIKGTVETLPFNVSPYQYTRSSIFHILATPEWNCRERRQLKVMSGPYLNIPCFISLLQNVTVTQEIGF